MTEDLLPGDVVKIDLPRHVSPGREQEGTRPAVVVGVPERGGMPRYPVLIVVPLTSQPGAWAARSPALYPRLVAGAAGLPYDSVALLDNVRGMDQDRIGGYWGTLTEEEYAPLREGLRMMLDLPEKAEEPKVTEEE